MSNDLFGSFTFQEINSEVNRRLSGSFPDAEKLLFTPEFIELIAAIASIFADKISIGTAENLFCDALDSIDKWVDENKQKYKPEAIFLAFVYKVLERGLHMIVTAQVLGEIEKEELKMKIFRNFFGSSNDQS